MPRETEIIALHKKYAPSEAAFELVFTHCKIVWQITEQLIEKSNPDVDVTLIKAACLLHDIGVYHLYLPNGEIDHANYILHGTHGDKILQEEGFDETIRRFASHHTGVGLSKQDVIDQNLPLVPADYLAETPEERLVMYADKFHTKTTPPKFMTAKTYEAHIARFGGHKILAFKKLQKEFGIPNLAPLIAKYHSELI